MVSGAREGLHNLTVGRGAGGDVEVVDEKNADLAVKRAGYGRDDGADGGTYDDGYLTISDRKKDVIVTGGENVSSIEVEDVISSHPNVREVAAAKVGDIPAEHAVPDLVMPGAGFSPPVGRPMGVGR